MLSEIFRIIRPKEKYLTMSRIRLDFSTVVRKQSGARCKKVLFFFFFFQDNKKVLKIIVTQLAARHVYGSKKTETDTRKKKEENVRHEVRARRIRHTFVVSVWRIRRSGFLGTASKGTGLTARVAKTRKRSQNEEGVRGGRGEGRGHPKINASRQNRRCLRSLWRDDDM